MGAEEPVIEQAGDAAVLFADVSGSTSLYEKAGDRVAQAAIETCINLLREKTADAQGRVIKTIGDEVMSWFATADAAADAAIEMQLAISELPRVGDAHIGVRIGFNHGPLVARGDDVFGQAVNVAARLANVATKGQIITAHNTVVLLSPRLKSATRAITSMQLKGQSEEVRVYELMWQLSGDMTMLASPKLVSRLKDAKLRLRVGGQEVVLSAGRQAVTFGRDQSSGLVINELPASRAHGKIERRLDKFILTDHSANGTFVTIAGEEEIVLRREDFTLRGHGWIACGQSRTKASDIVEFFCE